MVKVTTPGLSAAEKEKYMVAVKKHGQLPDVIVTRETTSTTFTIDTNSATKTTVVGSCPFPRKDTHSREQIILHKSRSASEKAEDMDVEVVDDVEMEKETKTVTCDSVGHTASDCESSKDVTKPLTIETQLGSASPGPSSESTDTASEAGSCFSSPNSTLSSCNSPRLAGGKSHSYHIIVR